MVPRSGAVASKRNASTSFDNDDLQWIGADGPSNLTGTEHRYPASLEEV